jgi:hypothetical protein
VNALSRSRPAASAHTVPAGCPAVPPDKSSKAELAWHARKRSVQTGLVTILVVGTKAAIGQAGSLTGSRTGVFSGAGAGTGAGAGV